MGMPGIRTLQKGLGHGSKRGQIDGENQETDECWGGEQEVGSQHHPKEVQVRLAQGHD